MAKQEKRQCSNCGSKEMIYGAHDVTRTYEENPITVAAVEGWLCSACGELEFEDAESAKRYFDRVSNLQQAIRHRQVEELRNIRKRLKLTQRQAAELFGGGANAFSDYERGVAKPARSTVMLLHLLDHHPELLDELRRQQVAH
jgi:HTH-type transcriptional regulator/antitoxin MqsA